MGKVRNCWGAMKANPNANGFGNLFLRPGDEEVQVNVMIGTYIGRQRFASSLSRPEQQYQLVWSEGYGINQGATPLQIDIARSTGDEDGLRLVRAKKLACGSELPVGAVALRLCTLEANGFWLDHGRFNLEWQA